MAEGNRKPELSDPEALARLLEIELAQKRSAWQQAHARRQNLRLLSFAFLLLVVGGAFLGFYLLYSSETLSDLKASRANSNQMSPSPTATPR